jgi:hypothetical protein
MRSLGVNITDKDIISLPKTLEEVKAMTWVEFQNWVFEKLHGRVSAKKVGDLGIDGRLFDGTPVQVKQQESVGRKVVDEFETTIRRNGKKKGLIVAFSFTKDAYEEAARAKLEEGLEITLKTVDELIKED